MKSAFTGAVWIGLILGAGNTCLLAQMQNNTEKQLSCDNGNNGDLERHCEMREQTVGAMGPLTVDAGENGGVTIKGSFRSDILVRSRVEAQAENAGAAANLTRQVSVIASAGQIKATGPQTSGHNSSWSVSYEIFVPQNTDLNLKANNGGVSISDVRGQIHFEVHNGGVKLKRIAGDVSGTTVNGGIQAELAGAIWDGRQLDVSTTNGGVKLMMPSNYSAHLQAETSNGGMKSDFANMVSDRRAQKLDVNMGSGGPLIHVATVNGGLQVSKSDGQ